MYVAIYVVPITIPKKDIMISTKDDPFIIEPINHSNVIKLPSIAIGIDNPKRINKNIIKVFFFIFPPLSSSFDTILTRVKSGVKI